jgi:hypothetical protein
LTLQDIVTVSFGIDSDQYRVPSYSIEDPAGNEIDVGDIMTYIAEGGKFSTIKFSTSDDTIYLRKYGIAIHETYEAARRMAMPVFRQFLIDIGADWGRAQTANALTVLIAGITSSVSGAINYDNLVDFDLASERHQPNLMVANKAEMKALLKLPEFKDPQVFDYARTGNMITPLGYAMKYFTLDSPDISGKIYAVDTGDALEMITETGSQITEQDTIINGQIYETTISEVVGFRQRDEDAVVLFDYS